MSRRERYFMKQKLMGLAIMILGLFCLTPFMVGLDCAIGSVVAIPFGLWLVITKKAMIVIEDYDEFKEDDEELY